MERHIRTPVASDLATKMVFVAGPRQVGKTTLARQILESYEHGVYLTWDRKEDRREIRAARWPAEAPSWVVLDELHKWPSWKRWLKGEFDTHRERTRLFGDRIGSAGCLPARRKFPAVPLTTSSVRLSGV